MAFRLKNSGINKYNTAKDVKIIVGGKDYFDSLEQLINEAQKDLYFQMYILEEDATGKRIINALTEAAKRKVEIFLLLDAFGSNKLSDATINSMKLCGINIRFFSPLMKSRRLSLGRRLHHKVVVADRRKALVGGINVASRYEDTDDKPGWLDFAVQLEGDVVEDIYAMCLKLWGRRFIRRRRKEKAEAKTESNIVGDILARTRENDWLRKKNNVSQSYKQAIRAAKEELLIVGGYFLPGRQFRHLLKNARKRNVDIKVILTQVSDFKPLLLAQRYLYDWMLRLGIKIYEYKPSMVHGKAMVVDKVWFTVGSYNLNYLSVYSNLEYNIDIYNEALAEEFSQRLNKIIEKDCEYITEVEYKRRNNMFTRFFQYINFVFVRFLMVLTVFLTRKPKRGINI